MRYTQLGIVYSIHACFINTNRKALKSAIKWYVKHTLEMRRTMTVPSDITVLYITLYSLTLFELLRIEIREGDLHKISVIVNS